MVDSASYLFGVRLALRTHGLEKTAALPAETLATVLKEMPPETPQTVEDRYTDKDPKDPDDSQTWSASGPFGGDNMSSMGLVPEAISDAGY